LNLLWLSSAPA